MTKTEFNTAPQQLNLKLEIAAEREVDGVGMGVFSDGTPFLTLRGLARMCGVDHASLIRMTGAWLDSPLKPREKKVRELVRAQGADDTIAFIATEKNGTIHHAVPAHVCMAVLEYYAFDARGEGEHALNSFRVLARKGFSDYIYNKVGFDPTAASAIVWQQYHDRVSLNHDSVPDGYFSIFKEVATLYVTLIQRNANVGPAFIPCISVGMAWGKHWVKENLDILFGERLRYDHNYPTYFPQSASNPQQAYAYPDESLAEFRKWLRESYFRDGLPKYLERKVKDRQIPAVAADRAIRAFQQVPASRIGRGPRRIANI